MFSVSTSALRDHVGGQLRRLANLIGLADSTQQAAQLLDRLLGSGGMRTSADPCWPSDVSDDHTPVEFSIAFDTDGRLSLRVLVEPTDLDPSPAANLAVQLRLLSALDEHPGISLDRFDAVRELFLRGPLDGKFALWLSLVLRAGAPPAVKVYLNPASRGQTQARLVVREALHRLGFDQAYTALSTHALSRGELDELSFFSIDLSAASTARVKVYISHRHATASDVQRAARAAADIDPVEVRDFIEAAGGSVSPFDARPLVTSYAYVTGDVQQASTFSVYHPVRDYVSDDEVALQRASALLKAYDVDDVVLRQAVDVLAQRPLTDGSGLIPHLAVRMGRRHTGTTVYLSSEAYRGALVNT